MEIRLALVMELPLLLVRRIRWRSHKAIHLVTAVNGAIRVAFDIPYNLNRPMLSMKMYHDHLSNAFFGNFRCAACAPEVIVPPVMLDRPKSS